MKGIIVKYDNQLFIQTIHPTYGKLVLEPDQESRFLLGAANILDEVEGCIIEFTDTEPDTNVKFNHWQFHIESFETS